MSRNRMLLEAHSPGFNSVTSLYGDRPDGNTPGAAPPRALVAIPARNEAELVGRCLLALAAQRGPGGLALLPGAFGVLLLVNNTDDGTADAARALRPRLPFPLRVAEAALPPERAHIGWARRLALDAAVGWAGTVGALVILGTDADGAAPPDWVATMLSPMERGTADAVAGTFATDPSEEALLVPVAVRARVAMEERLAAALDRLASLLDPDPCDPWPRHDVHSGASFGLTVAAYRALGGMRPLPALEDRWLFRDLRRRDARIRHVLGAPVRVSARLDGRAAGGLADTMRRRVAHAARADDLPVDERLDPLADALRVIALRTRARAVWRGDGDGAALARRLRLPAGEVAERLDGPVFGEAWDALRETSPILRRREFPPARLAAEARAATRLVARVEARSRDLVPEGASRWPVPVGPRVAGAAARF